MSLPAYSPPSNTIRGALSNGNPPPREYLGSMVIEGRVPLTLPDYTPQKDITAIYKATTGMGTRDVKLIKALLGKSSAQAQVLEVAYENHTNKNLITRIIDETSSDYQTGLIMLAKGAVGGDAHLLTKIGDVDQEQRLAILTDVLIGRTKDEMALLKGFLRSRQQTDLKSLVIDALPPNQSILKEIFEEALKVQSPPTTDNMVDKDLGDLASLTGLAANGIQKPYSREVLPSILDRAPNHLVRLDAAWHAHQHGTSLSTSISTLFSNKPDVASILCYAIDVVDTQFDQFDFGIKRDALRLDDAIIKKQWLVVTVRLIRAYWDKKRFKQIIGIVDNLRQGNDGTVLERLKGSKRSLISPFGASNELVSLWKEMILEGTF